MRQYTVWLVVAVLAIGMLGTYSLWNKDMLLEKPTAAEKPLVHLSVTATDMERNLYAVSRSKQHIMKLDKSGVLQYEINQPETGDTNRSNFTEIAADSKGSLFVLDTMLDTYGLYVMSERIDRYDADGRFAETVYRIDYNEDTKMLRTGKIKSLQIRGSSLYFFTVEKGKATLQRKAIPSGKLENVTVAELPENRYLSEIYGTEPGSIYYTSKRGGIYNINKTGDSVFVYPQPESDHTRRNFPERLTMDGEGRLYFIDRYLNEISRVDPAQPGVVETLISEDEIKQYAPDVESYEIVDFQEHGQGALDVILADRIIRIDDSGKFHTTWSSAVYSSGERTLRWLIWLTIPAMAALMIFIGRIVFIRIMKRKISLILKQIVIFVPVVTVAMLLLANFVYTSFSKKLEQQMEHELAVLARNGKNIIDGDRLLRLNSPEQFMNEDYKAIKTKMNFLFEGNDTADRRGLYSTLYKYENGRLFIITDDDDSVNMFKPFEITEDNSLVLNNGEVRTGQWEDSEGAWTYAIAPVYDSAGKVVGIYETGRDMNVLHQSNQKVYASIVQNIMIIAGVLLVILGLMTFYILSSIRKLRNSVMEMANGNWNAEVNIRTNDEVAELGEQFNYMARHIRKYVGDVTEFSEASFRFVPQQFFKFLGKQGILDIHLGDQVQRDMVVMVAGIRSFYQISKNLTPFENFNFMNSFLKRFGPFVRSHDGLINKYLGAGFMSLFADDPEGALKAAIEIRKELIVYNGHRAKVGYKPIDIGISIHRGPLMLGIIGEEKRLEGNVISDDVNLTTMLEKMSESLGVSILITEQTLHRIKDYERYGYRSLGRVKIDGKDQTVHLYDVYEGDTELLRLGKEKTKKLFERGIHLFQEGRFYDARETFIEVIKLNRMDKAAKLYFYMCDEYFQNGTSADWSGALAVS